MQRTVLAWLAPLALGLSIAVNAAHAQKAPAVLELYTSQGCSSCPPADRLLGDYAKRRDVVALSFNVDYWDYLGWKDTLGNPAYSQRQRTYALKRGDGEVYTPQVVVNGMSHAIGSIRRQIDRAISRSSRHLANVQVPLSVKRVGDKLVIEVGDGASLAKPATIWLAAVKSKVTVPVRHGENRGRTLTYHNVVRRMTAVGMWAGKRTVVQLMNADVLQGKADTCAVLVQIGKGGPIVAARWMPDSG